MISMSHRNFLCLMDSANYIRLMTDRMAESDFLLLSRVKLNMFEVLH